MREISRAGQGEMFAVLNKDAVDSHTSDFLDYIRAPLLTDIQVEFSHVLMQTADLQPVAIPDLFSRRPVFLTGQLTLPESIGNDDPVISLRGTRSDGEYINDFPLLANTSKANRAVQTVWARQKTDDLLREMSLDTEKFDDFRQQIVDLGLAHSLLTRFTSFVAVDHVIRAPDSASAEVDLTKRTSPALIPAYSSGFSLGNGPISISTSLQTVSVSSLRTNSEYSDPLEVDGTDPEPETTLRRHNITFILGEDSMDSDNTFYTDATDWFLTQPEAGEVIIHLRSLVEMRDWLATRRFSEQPWGTINLVVHASPWTSMRLPVDDTDDAAGLNRLAEFLGTDTAELADDIVDDDTLLRVYACGLGQQRELLDLLSRFLGGQDRKRPVVESPSAFVVFGPDPDSLENTAWLMPVDWRFDPAGVAGEQYLTSFPESTAINLVQAIEPAVMEAIPHPAILATRLPVIEAQMRRLNATVADFRWRFNHNPDSGETELIGSSILYVTSTSPLGSGRVGRLIELDFSHDALITRVEPAPLLPR